MKKVKRILAMAGVILLAGLYVAAFVSAILAKPAADGFFKASLLRSEERRVGTECLRQCRARGARGR